MRILLVEDEAKVARFIQKGLEAEGYEVETASDGKTGEKKAKSADYDFIILDILLPKKNGFEVLQSLRKEGNKTPILVLTARSGTEDIVQGLDLGADDYLTKPFAFNELLARVRSLLRRETRSKTVLKVNDLQLNTVTHKATRNGITIDLTSREYAMLEFLMHNTAKLVTRQQLAKEVWGFDFDPGTNIVDVYINHLRKKIDQKFEKKLLHTVRGRGYYLSDKEVPKNV
ncbi:MAG: response regulator transcription factor [Ignavibacteriales bacterium]|nr:response regulator transcription factor [Ignavibacteriales bacterium]MBI3788061.1 response regulator transcription factor [Ignavibacteriales bacterium]